MEYAIKHDGASFNVIPTYGVPWWKLANLDVYALLAAVVLLVLYLLVIVLPRFVFRKLFGRKTSGSDKKTN